MSFPEPNPQIDVYRKLEAAVDEVLDSVRVLFVDDNTLSCRIGYRVLSELGATVECATSGQEALQLVESSEFDVIVLDCGMPGMSGFDVARRLRSPGSRAEATPIVALTAMNVDGVRQRALDAGMEQVLCKPFSSDAMLSALKIS